MKTLNTTITSASKSSRVELFVRILWAILSCIVLFFFSIVAIICVILHWIYILITGKRSKGLNDVLKSYVIYRFRVDGYLMMLTDERNPLIPQA
jgi:hypothetical protein